MNWPVVIGVFAAWFALMAWMARKTDRVAAMSLLMTSGYVLLPVPVNLAISAVFGLKAAAVTLTGAAMLLIGKSDSPLRWPPIRWWDVFMPAWLVVEVAAEISNHRPGRSAAVVGAEFFIQWLLPYLLGRIILRRAADFVVLARMVVWAGLLLTPLALYETLFGPYLHRTLYGIALISSVAKYPLILNHWGPSNYRPMLFFEGSHLASSFYFGAAAVVQAFLMSGGGGAFVRRKWNVLTLLVLIATVIDSRAFLGSAVLLSGLFLLLSVAVIRTRILLILMLLVLPVYVGLRASGIVATPELTGSGHADFFHKDYSLWFRMYQEEVIMQTVKDRHASILGLGSTIPGYQDWRQFTGPKTGLPDIFWIDSLWVWLVVRTGWLGLSMAYLAVAAPLTAALWILRLKRNPTPRVEIFACLAMWLVVVLDLNDWIMNSHQSTLWAFALGGLAGIAAPGIAMPKALPKIEIPPKRLANVGFRRLPS